MPAARIVLGLFFGVISSWVWSAPIEANPENRLFKCRYLPEGDVCTEPSSEVWGELPSNAAETRREVIVTTQSGRTVTFQDKGVDNPAVPDARHDIKGFISKHNYVLVHGIYYGEESDYKLVSLQSGATFTVKGFPVFSPDGTHFLVIPYKHGHEATSGEIYKIDRHSVTPVASFEFKNCREALEPIWVSPTDIAIFAVTQDSKTRMRVTKGLLVRVKRQGTKWEIVKSESK